MTNPKKSSHQGKPEAGPLGTQLQKYFGADYIDRILSLAQSDSGHFHQVTTVPDAEEETEIVKQSQDLHRLVEQIAIYCKEELGGVTTGQIRNIFELVLKNGNHFSKLPFIRPRIAYYAAKIDQFEGNDKEKAQRQIELFAYLLDQLIVQVSNPAQLESLRLFLEAIVAYHKGVIERQKEEKGRRKKMQGREHSQGGQKTGRGRPKTNLKLNKNNKRNGNN